LRRDGAGSRSLLLMRKLSKYKCQLVTLFPLILLSWYTLKYWPERLFELLVFIVVELQLELAYRQWWLERERDRPHLWVEVEWWIGVERGERYLSLYAENIGSTYACGVEFRAQICSTEIPEKCYTTSLYKDPSYKGVIAPGNRVLVGTIGSPDLPPSKIDVSRISIEIEACYIDALEGNRRCEYFVWTSSQGTRRKARELPGLLTKIPEMLKDCLSS